MTEGIDARAYAPAGPGADRRDRGVTRQRPHYAALDGLRGLAAISVLLFHLGHWQGHPWLAANAGLAVDFFFCLSGYVLSVAYRETLDQGMATRTFAVLRLVRLMPLVILGTLISAAYLAARIVMLHDSTISVAELASATAFGLLCLPMLDARLAGHRSFRSTARNIRCFSKSSSTSPGRRCAESTGWGARWRSSWLDMR